MINQSEERMDSYLAASTLVFFLFGVLWKTDSLLNQFFKVTLLALSVWGFVLVLTALGYLVKR